MFERYPKSGKRMLGEQKATTFASASGSVGTEYQRKGSSDRYPASGHKGPNSRHTSREKMRSPYHTAGGSKQVSASYPDKKHQGFPSEGVQNKLVSPTSRPPKKA